MRINWGKHLFGMKESVPECVVSLCVWKRERKREGYGNALAILKWQMQTKHVNKIKNLINAELGKAQNYSKNLITKFCCHYFFFMYTTQNHTNSCYMFIYKHNYCLIQWFSTFFSSRHTTLEKKIWRHTFT